MAFPQTTKQNGFTIALEPETRLGSAMLMVEFEDRTYQPIGMVENLKEAHEMADADMRVRLLALDAENTPACPQTYVVWARGIDGVYCEAGRIEPF